MEYANANAFSTGLTIPLQITLSDIKLSAFIILVFSRQKGLTLVFRNDPLESLKVSSTFDSIPFVANYLQKEIEAQLRILLMDELPAIIHRLSLRLWVPEHNTREERELNTLDTAKDEPIIDPLASPPQDPVDSTGHALNPTQIASLSLDSGIETQSLFSQKNLIRLATLTDSHRTLSLFTPTIPDAVFRAWAGPIERGEFTGLHTRTTTPALSRTQSYAGSVGMNTTYTFDSGLRPLNSFTSGSGLGGSRSAKGHGTRKRKKRVVNLRKQPEGTDIIEDGSTMTDSASVTESMSGSAPSVFSAPPATSFETHRDIESVFTPPLSPITAHSARLAGRPRSPTYERRQPRRNATLNMESERTPGNYDTLRPKQGRSLQASIDLDATPRASMYLPERKLEVQETFSTPAQVNKSEPASSSSSKPPIPNFLQFITDPANSGSIAEKAWMMNMANEVSRRYEEEREKGNFVNPRVGSDEVPPPAYAR
jgi:mitochondrial distribution and morphology protein 34